MVHCSEALDFVAPTLQCLLVGRGQTLQDMPYNCDAQARCLTCSLS